MNRHERGFTLIELLIVVVVIGILATIAIPKFSRMREKSYVAAVTSDLKNVASQQEIYLANNYSYAASVADMGHTLTDRVTITINEATGQGWAATGVHDGFTGSQCGFYYGNASASNASPATQPGTVVCN
jgi:type IV pilus assembly protein PilE